MSLSFHGSQMAFSISKFPTFSVTIPPNITKLLTKEESFQYRLTCRCAAAKQQQQRSGDGTPATKKKNKPIKPRNNGKKSFSGDGFEIEKSSGGGVELLESQSEQLSPYSALPLPKPPAGFVLDEQGKVLLASNKRIATIVDSATNFPLECVIRRIFKNSRGEECMLLCPVDMLVMKKLRPYSQLRLIPWPKYTCILCTADFVIQHGAVFATLKKTYLNFI